MIFKTAIEVSRLSLLTQVDLTQKYINGCQGVVQLGSLVQGSPSLVPQRLRLVSLFYSLNFTCVENKGRTLG